jgi:hypothetical protein
MAVQKARASTAKSDPRPARPQTDRIARLKHTFGMARARYRGEGGTQRTAYWAAIANNLVVVVARAAV